MAHVQLRTNPDGYSMQLLVDGVDLSRSALREGLSIHPAPEDDFMGGWCLTLTIAADTLEVDLPEAVLDALKAEVA